MKVLAGVALVVIFEIVVGAFRVGAVSNAPAFEWREPDGNCYKIAVVREKDVAVRDGRYPIVAEQIACW